MPEFAHFNYYLGLNEGSVVGMADAFARYRQKPVVVQLHSYAGLANGFGMIPQHATSSEPSSSSATTAVIES